MDGSAHPGVCTLTLYRKDLTYIVVSLCKSLTISFSITASNMHLQGVILYEMLSGSSPFDEEETDYVLDQIILQQFSAEARDLIKKLLVVEPEERLSSEQILRHPWLQVKLVE